MQSHTPAMPTRIYVETPTQYASVSGIYVLQDLGVVMKRGLPVWRKIKLREQEDEGNEEEEKTKKARAKGGVLVRSVRQGLSWLLRGKPVSESPPPLFHEEVCLSFAILFSQ